jgi:hypothetical protein
MRTVVVATEGTIVILPAASAAWICSRDGGTFW